MCALCQAEVAAKTRLRAAQRLAVAAYDEHFGYDVALRQTFRPTHDDHTFDRELGRIDVVGLIRKA